MSDYWDRRFLSLAKHVAGWSKDPSTKAGAVVADARNRVISLGFNGFPQLVADTRERLSNREIKYKLMVHAEANALLFAQRPLNGTILYTWPMMPCAPCAAMVIQAGIKRVVAPHSENERWQEDFALSQETFKEAGVHLVIWGGSLPPARNR